MRRLALAAAIAAILAAQQPDLKIDILKPQQAPALAVPDFRGDAQSQPLTAAFNETLWRDLDDSAYFQMVPKTHYPTAIPQLPSDLRPQEWSAAPAQATYLAMGYTAVQNGSFMLRGWLMDVRTSTPAGAQLFEQRYGESVDVAGARQAAHRFAADILAKLGATSLLGTHIYFVHESRPAPDRRTEIRMMDYDGANQRPIARANSIFTQPAVSPDGSKVAFSQVLPRPELMLYSVDPARALPFRNQKDLSAVGSPSFTPDGRQIVFAQSVNGRGMQIFIANADGTNQRNLTGIATTDVEPKVNPKSGAQMVFVSGRAGHQQIYSMNLDGADVERVSDGTGEAANPSWHPNGQLIAFAWTQGYAAGAWNIFVMNVATRQYLQLTHDAGRNENPVWAPDGRHIVFMSTRSGKPQIWSMLADGSQPPRQLTTEGSNSTPVWGR